MCEKGRVVSGYISGSCLFLQTTFHNHHQIRHGLSQAFLHPSCTLTDFGESWAWQTRMEWVRACASVG